MALQREEPFPLIIMEGTLDVSEELLLKAETEVLCTFKGNLIEATLGLLASYYVFTYFVLYVAKCILKINKGKKLPSSGMIFVNKIDSLQRN